MAKCDSAGREWGGDGGQRGGHKIMCTCEILAVIKAVEPAKIGRNMSTHQIDQCDLFCTWDTKAKTSGTFQKLTEA